MDGDTLAAQAHIDSLPEPRRSQMQHLHDVITAAIPDAEDARPTLTPTRA